MGLGSLLSFLIPASQFPVLNPPGPNDVVKGKGTTGTVFDAQGAAAYNTAKRFYAQRNFYLTGITLLMAFVVARYYQLLVHALEIESQLRETRIRLGGVDALNREIDDFRLRVNDLDSQNKELSEKLRKAEKKIEDLTPKPATADEPPLESALEDETETGALGSGLRKRQ